MNATIATLLCAPLLVSGLAPRSTAQKTDRPKRPVAGSRVPVDVSLRSLGVASSGLARQSALAALVHGWQVDANTTSVAAEDTAPDPARIRRSEPTPGCPGLGGTGGRTRTSHIAGTVALGSQSPAEQSGRVGPSGVSFGTRPTSAPPTWAPLLPGSSNIPLGGTYEPTIVGHPLEPLDLAYADSASGTPNQLRITHDGGQTWQAPAFAVSSPNHGCCADSSLAYDSRGRLFWSYLGGVFDGEGNLIGLDIFFSRCDPVSGAILPGYPVNVTASASVNKPGSSGFNHDKLWLAADIHPASPFRDRLYMTWTEFEGSGNTIVWAIYSTDQGLTWSVPLRLSENSEGFVWPVHNTVAPNGDVYVAYHETDSVLSGTRGRALVLRSTNGGETYPQKTAAFARGDADVTFNVQDQPGAIPGTQFWLQGSAQAWVLADPKLPGRIYVVANDDPDNDPSSGDPADVFIAISADDGQTWSSPERIDSGPGTSFQVMPTASIDPDTGLIAIHYYDNRRGNLNSGGRFLLDVFATFSLDGGATFVPDFQINDVPFDPDPGAPVRFPGPPPTLRIGEYNGVAVAGYRAHAVWCGNTFDGTGTPVGQQSWYEGFGCPPSVAAVDPAKGPFRGGNTVMVVGECFTPSTTVDFGGVPSPAVTFSSATELWVEVPSWPLPPRSLRGPINHAAVFTVVDVSVAEGARKTTLPGAYTYEIELRRL